MTDWLAWVDVLEDAHDVDGPRVRRYVAHGVPFFQLTPFRSAAARYRSRDAARVIASYAADLGSPSGTEEAPRRPAPVPRRTSPADPTS